MRLAYKIFFSFFIFILCSSFNVNPKTHLVKRKKQEQPQAAGLCKNIIGVYNAQTKMSENYVFDKSLYELKVYELQQVKYWRAIMNLHQDTGLVCLSHNRVVLDKVCMKDWDCRNEFLKKNYRDSIKCYYNADSTHKVLLTSGKKFFYDFEKASQNIDKGIHCFIENGVDPWYAQAILLIESPNKLQKSNVGAYGSFQLMKEVARLFGLKVNRQIDERANFERSAFAASSLIKKICIPKAIDILDSMKIFNVNQDELWFKLLVMHVYHAGSGNVQKALFSISPAPLQGSMDLIYTLWKTSVGAFKMASQNYSQLVLAAMLEMNERKGLNKLIANSSQ